MFYRMLTADGVSRIYEGSVDGEFVTLDVCGANLVKHVSEVVTASNGNIFERSAKLNLPLFNGLVDMDNIKALGDNLVEASKVIDKEVLGAFNKYKKAWLDGTDASEGLKFTPEDFQWTFQQYYGAQLENYLGRVMANAMYPEVIKTVASTVPEKLEDENLDIRIQRARYLSRSILPYRDNTESIESAEAKLSELVKLLAGIGKGLVDSKMNNPVEGVEFSDEALTNEVRALKAGDVLKVKFPDGIKEAKVLANDNGCLRFESVDGESMATTEAFAKMCEPVVKKAAYFKAGDRVVYNGGPVAIIFGLDVKDGDRGVVEKGGMFNTIYTDPSNKLVRVRWDTGQVLGVKASELMPEGPIFEEDGGGLTDADKPTGFKVQI